MEKLNNIVMLTDSYKIGHHNMYLDGTEKVYSYFEARKGAKFNETVFFGLQYILKNYFEGVVVTKEKIDEAEKFCEFHFGNKNIFKRERWDYIIEKHGGKLPIKIKAVPEGSRIPIDNVMMTVENTDPNCCWLTNHCETILTHVWQGCNVATISYEIKKLFKTYLNYTCDDGEKFAGINFMLHDFGFRGTSSIESAAIGGAGHLINFMGTDTIIAPVMIKEFYNNGNYPNAFSVAATEHSIMTSKGKEGEAEVIEHIIDNYPDGILSVVSDSYNIYRCVEDIYGEQFKHKILARNGKFVVRPDSGDPVEVMCKVIEILGKKFGYTINKKGYKILNPKVGIIWGDGIDYEGIRNVLEAIMKLGWSVENCVFGMGGGLLQKHNRDTQRFAFKCSAQFRDGKWVDVYKDPIDGSKASKRGRLKLIRESARIYKTVDINYDCVENDVLKTVFENGQMINEINDWNSVINANI